MSTDVPNLPQDSPGDDQFLSDESWQPNKEDALLTTDSEDVLDDGLTAPDTDPLASLDLTESGQREGETWDDRLAREEPEVWEEQPPADASDQAGTGINGEEPTGEESAVGTLVAAPDDDDPSDRPGEEQDVFAATAARTGNLAPEEQAMHLEDQGIAVDEGGTIEPDGEDVIAGEDRL
ncbi:hypothetical protein FE374_15615 [Georgenia yuyongxinii]|uniref:DUF5709 domain-containing protein n=1 Tax=Georgenia yuyongxinii TaxID=2589797 RepID=A0A5B8C9J7_9MICO|nr:hypothetical protein [Georgenia yuyongxinii]QDC25852.1 hypothetical protein FE374_15615 [Georgenia yuyongxinii]